MTYKYSPPPRLNPSQTRNDITIEFSRWNTQAEDRVLSDWDLPLAKSGQVGAECVFLLRGNRVRVAVDKWADFAVNLRCCYLVIREMRLAEARGVAEATREAYLMLAPPLHDRDPYEVLGIRPDCAWEDVEAMYRIKSQRAHPDKPGGSTGAMQALNAAYERIKAHHK